MNLQLSSFLSSWEICYENFKNDKIWKPTKRYNSKSYGPLATILPLHLPYLRNKVYHKFHPSRTTKIKFIKKKLWALDPYSGITIHPVIVHVYTNFQLSSFLRFWEICYENFQEWQNLKRKTYQDIIPKSYGPFAPIPVYTIHPVIVYVYTNFRLSSFLRFSTFSLLRFWEICYEYFQEW